MSIARNRAAALAMLLLGSAIGGTPALAQPVELRIANFAPPPLELTQLWAEKPDVVKHHGKSYVVKNIQFRASPIMLTAFASNEVDLVHLGPASLNLAVHNAGLGDARVIAEEIIDGADGYYSTSFFVLKDGPIKTAADLKGKVLGTFAVNSNADLAARNYLSTKFGLEYNRDYTLLEAAPPNQKAILMEKKVDLATLIPPFAYDPEVLEKARVLFTARDGYGKPVTGGYWIARAPFIAKHRAALVDFYEDFLRMGRWVWDPKNRDEALEISSKVSKVPVAVMKGFQLTNKDAFRPLDGMPNIETGQIVIDAHRRLGMSKTDLKLTDYVDLSLIKAANDRLK